MVNSIVYYNKREGDDGINYNLNGYSLEALQEFNVVYSNVEGDEAWMPNGEGNIDEDPLFTDPENSDYTLQEGSPCIDAGTEIEGIVYYGLAPDMGAFEFISMMGDINQDDDININDVILIISIILETWNPTNDEFLAADINVDGVIDKVLVQKYAKARDSRVRPDLPKCQP